MRGFQSVWTNNGLPWLACLRLWLIISRLFYNPAQNRVFFRNGTGLVLCLVGSLFLGACRDARHGVYRDKSFSDDSTKIVFLFSQTKVHKDSSAWYIQQAARLTENSGNMACTALFLALRGKEFIFSGDLDSATFIANAGLALNLDSAHLFYRGKFYNLKGQVEGLKKNGYSSIDYYLKAEKIFSAMRDSNSLAGIYSNIANTYFSLKDNHTALLYASRAYQLKNSVKESHIKTNVITTYALSLIKTKQSSRALLIEAEADSIATATNNILAKLASNIGFAEIYKSNHQVDKAITYYEKCILLSQKAGIKHFELISQVGLISAYEELKRPGQITAKADTILLLAKQLHNTDVLHAAKRIIAKAYADQKEFQKAFQYLNESYTLYDSLAGTENQKNINELIIKYDSKQKENEILNQNYVLEKQRNDLKDRQFIILFLSLGLSVLLVLLFYIKALNKEKVKRLELEKQKNISDAYIIGENQERKRLSFEIHDGIASMITAIILKLRADSESREEMISLMQQLHEDTRRISYNLRPVNFEEEGFVAAIEHLCHKLSTSQIDVSFICQSGSITLNDKKSILLYRIIQELVNNALKHAHCKSIFVAIKTVGNSLQTSVHDDGKGVALDLKGSGLETVKERVKALNGTIHIETHADEGTTIIITHDTH